MFASKGDTPHLLADLGFRINRDKSDLAPTRSMTFLGMVIESVPFMAKPTQMTVDNLLSIMEEFLSHLSPPVSLWRRLFGLMTSLSYT